jgi:outer membrane phospholipase A
MGEFLRVAYVGEVPGNLRGRVRIDAVDLDTPPMIVQLSTAAAHAQIRLSFRLRLYEPADRTSRRVLDDLYLGYTQAAFRDLTANSTPFLDTRHVPSRFYFVPATDWRVGGNAVGVAAGIEHESNGPDGAESRSLDTLFVRACFTFGDPADFHWTFSPKRYAYLERSENPDIQTYRGYGDYRFTCGKNSDWQVARTVRVGCAIWR